MVGLTVLQSGQPYSVIDFTGAVGSIFYGINNGITNPIVPLAPGCTREEREDWRFRRFWNAGAEGLLLYGSAAWRRWLGQGDPCFGSL